MKEITGKIPVLNSEDLDIFHFGQVQWQLPFANASYLFHINRIEDIKDKMPFPVLPHRKMVYDLIFLTKGKSIRSKGLNEYNFGKNQFFFLPALQITSHEFLSEDAEGFFVHFDLAIFKQASLERQLNQFSFLNFLSNPIITIPEDALVPILNILCRLEKIYLEKEGDFSLVVFYILTLFKEVSAFVVVENTQAKSAASILAQKYKEALSQYIYQKQKVAEYADLLNVSPNHLNKCVKKITSKSAQELLNEMLILEAKSLLKYSNLQTAEIAVKLFNQTPSNFARFFKKQTGFMPKEYK